MPLAQPITVALSAVALALGAAPDPGPDDPYADLVRASVFAERTGVEPGGTVWVGVHFEIEDGWHTYWPGQNDSGFGTRIETAAPEGVVVGAPRWPAPKRYLAPGDILDHVHERAVTALLPVTAPRDAEVGSVLELSFDLSWLVCEDVCIPGWETLTLALPVRESPDNATGLVAERIGAARARLPRAIDQGGTRIAVTWRGSLAEVRAGGAKNLSFYPDEGGSSIPGLATSGTTTSGVLRLAFDTPEPVLSGVLEIHGSGDTSELFLIRSARGGED